MNEFRYSEPGFVFANSPSRYWNNKKDEMFQFLRGFGRDKDSDVRESVYD